MEELFAHSKALRAAKADSRTERKLPEGHKDRGEIWTKCAFCCRLGRRVSLNSFVAKISTDSITVYIC